MSESRTPYNAKGTTRDVNAAKRAMLALELRAKKLSYDEIARQCGYADRGACHKAVQRELDRHVVANVDELRREESMMLDQLHAVCWEMAMDKSNKGRLFAVDRVIAIAERRAKLLGLDTKPDDEALQQHYTKRIIIASETTTEVQV